MADKVIRVPVVAEFQTDLRSLQDIEKALSGAFEKAGAGTTIAKGLRDSLTKIRPLLKEYEQLQIQPTIDQAGVRRMNTIFDAIIGEYQKRASQIEFADPEAMLPEEVLTRIRTMRAEVASLRKEMEGIERHGVSGKSDDYFSRREAAQQDLHRKAKAMLPSKYSGDATLQQNASTVEKEAIAAAQRAEALAEQGKKLAEALQQAEDSVQEAQTALRQATGDLQTATTREGKAQKAVNASKFYAALGGLTVSKTKEHAIVGGSSLRQSAFVDQSGKLQTEFQTMLRSVLQEAGVEIDTSRLIAESNASEIPSKIRQAIVEVLGDSEEAITQVLEDFKARAQTHLMRVDTEGFTNADQFLKSAREQKRTAQTAYDRAQQKAKEAPEKAFAIGYQIEENNDAQREAQETAAALQTLSIALKEVATAAKEAAVAAKKSEAESKEHEVRETTEKEKNKIGQSLENTNRNLGSTREIHQEGNRRQGERFSQESNAQREAEAFKASMQNAIKQWFSVQQIINIVKQGIRQAYQDIQGLDKAMTNIAVVTDMSVSDLWGKINEYMSVAQQYGVTTQGVYEVSQLYYQQGLSTNEVTAATTETLKLARIAGMGYAEAADAMTVAIRSFKMEMSDAVTVTDVYSKVAAVTASDSEELAIAMSKTASSAESVGSSFENTTAMLAVMIETTRESAQNLGSALKSIISRYGEMKVGLTVDSEGEEIDYNKVDTALKSVGISIKDAQGQFRDFDDVIFELSAKWDSLDKNTQRYIATIMAGNRQQSRFIALVDNWERLDEVAGAAHNAEDAGLLQYAKTLDSLETKINNIKTSFQQFYMNIINGPAIGAALDFVNKLIQGLNKLGSLNSILNLASIILGLKAGLTAIGNLFANSFSGIITQWRNTQKNWLNLAIKSGRERGYAEGRAEREGYEAGVSGADIPTGGSSLPKGYTPSPYGKNRKQRWSEYKQMSFMERRQLGMQNKKVSWRKNSWNGSAWGQGTSIGGQIVGGIASAVGTALTANTKEGKYLWQGAAVSALGNAAQGASMGAALGPWGAAIGGLIGALSGLPAIIKSLDKNVQMQHDYEKAKEKAEKANIERAEKTDEYNTLKQAIESYDELKANRNNSEEDYQAWISLNNQLIEKYPELISYMDEQGNAIADVNKATGYLEQSMNDAAKASRDYYNAKTREYELQVDLNKDYQYKDTFSSYGADVVEDVVRSRTLAIYKAAGLITEEEASSHILGLGRYQSFSNDYVTFGQSSATTTPEQLANFVSAKGWDWDTILELAKYWEANGEKALFSDAHKTQYKEDLLYFIKILADQDMMADKIFAKENGEIVGLNSHLASYITGSYGLKELEGTKATAASSNLYWLSQMSEADDAFVDYMEGATGIIQAYIESLGQSEETIASWKDSTEYDMLLQDLFSSWGSFNYRIQDEISKISENLDSYTLVGLQSEFKKLLGNTYADNPVYKAVETFWLESNYNRAARYGNALNTSENVEFEDYKTWSDSQTGPFKSEAEKRKAYYEATIKNIRDELGAGLANFIATQSDQTIENYIQILEDQEALTRQGGHLKQIAEARQKEFNKIFENINESGEYVIKNAQGAIIKTLSATDTARFTSLLTADNFGTSEWAAELTALEKELGVELGNFEALVYESLITQVETTKNKLKKINEKISNYSKLQKEGFNIDDATVLFELLREENSNLQWEDVFKYNEDGLLVLKDFNETMKQLFAQEIAKANKLRDEISTTIANLKLEDADSMFTGTGELKGTDGTVIQRGDNPANYITQVEDILKSQYKLTETQATAAAAMIESGAIKSREQLIAFLEQQGITLGATVDYYNRELEKIFGAHSLGDYISSQRYATPISQITSLNSLESWGNYALENNLIKGKPVWEEDSAGNKIISSYEYDWKDYFSNLHGVSVDKYGELTITEPAAYAQSLVTMLNESDQTVINDIYESVFEQYHVQWQQRQDELETFFADDEYSDEEVAKMFSWSAGQGMTLGDMSMEEFAKTWDLEKIDDVWQATTEKAYYQILTYAIAQNPDLDFDDLPKWKDWAMDQAAVFLAKRDEAVEFLRDLSKETGPEALEEAITLGLLKKDSIIEEDIKAFRRGELSVYDLIVSQRGETGYDDPELEAAWKYGQEKSAIETAEWITNLIKKSILTSEELLEIWELLGSPGNFKDWTTAEDSGFVLDEIIGQYTVTAAAYDKLAAAAVAKGSTEIPSRLDFQRTLNKGQKEVQDAKTSAISALTSDATISNLDALYEAKLISEAEYLQAIAEVEIGNKTYYQAIIDLLLDETDKTGEAVNNVRAKEEIAIRTNFESLFGDNKLNDEMVQAMYAASGSNDSMAQWAADTLGITYKNGEWVIENVTLALQGMAAFFASKHGKEAFDQYLSEDKQQEFLAKWAHAQDLQKEAEIAFLEGISPESSEEILTEAVELGIATWEDIASYKQKGYSAFDTIRAIVNKGKNTEQQTALRKSYQQYQQETMDTVEALFTDGLFSQEDLEGLWLASGTGATFDQWISEQTFFEKVGNDWVIKSREAYDEMIQWIADTYGPAFVAAIPSYEKLEAMGMLAEETRKEDQLGYLRGLVPDSMEIADLEKAVELGIISEGEMLAAIKNDADYWSIIKAAVGRMDAETQKAFAEARASYITNLMDEAEAWVETTTWTTEQLFEVFGGSDSWMTSKRLVDGVETQDFTLDLDTGEWKVTTREGYEDLKRHISTMYRGAYDALMPKYEELQAQYGFKDLISENDKVDIIKDLSYDVSLDDLEKLAEAGMITYQQAVAIWDSSNPWATLQEAIVLTSQEQLDAYNQMVVENNIAMGEAAQAFFDDSVLTWSEVTTLWTSQLGKTNSENNIVRWAQTAGLEYIDGEWKIASEKAYNNMVAAAKELYGDAWAAMIPTKEDILAQNLLGEQIARDSKVSFIEGLDLDKITASDMQKAIEEGIITSEQLLWADTYNISYEKLLRMAISMDAEMTQAFNESWAEVQLNKRESMEALFDDSILSQEEVFQMWKDLGSGQTFDSWLTGSGITFDGTEFRMATAAGFATVREWAKAYWGTTWDSIPWSQITKEQWEAGLTAIEDIDTQAALDSFFSGLTEDAGMDEAYKAVELGILTQEQLLHALSQGFSIWDIIVAYAENAGNEYKEFLDRSSILTRGSNLSQALSIGQADSWSWEQLYEVWNIQGSMMNGISFEQWAQGNGFVLNESGQWEAATRDAYDAMLKYIGTTFGEEYVAALPTADDWEAANLIKKARTSTDRTDFIRGLTADVNVEDVYEKALEYGIIEAYKDEAGNVRIPSIEELLAGIGANLHAQEDVDAYNEAMIAINEDRAATAARLMEDNSFTAEEIYDIYKHTRGSDETTFDDWYEHGTFIRQADGTYRMAAEGAYQTMVTYVTEAFGKAFVALLPTEEQWKALGIFEDLQTQENQINFLTKLDVNATIDSLNKAAELFGITFTETQLNAIKDGSTTIYDTILDALAPENNITGERVGPMKEIVGEIEKANEYSLITKLPFGQLLTTAEDYAKAYETLITLMPEANIAEILEDRTIGLSDTIAILENSLAYASVATYNKDAEITNAGEALLYAATAYGIALEDFFEMSVASPAQTLRELGIQLNQLSTEQYDTYRNAQKTYIDGMTSLISGTGTVENAQKMRALINSGLDADEQWDYSVFLDTTEGIQLDRSKFFEALSILREQDNELYGAIRNTLVSSPELLGKDLDSVMEVQQAINELATEQIDLLDEQNAALREQASIYGEIYAQMSMNKSEGWDFLNAELHGNAENFITWGNSVKSTFEQLGSSDGIDPTAFINMLNYMQQMGASVETLGGNFASWGDLMLAAYDAFGEAILTGTNITVDDLGISTDDMTNAMLDSMKKTAKQQVEFLDGQIAMLEGIKALSELEDLSIPSITATFADAIEKYNVANGADITLDDLHIVVNGKKFNLTEDELKKAQTEYNSMFSDSGISFAEALQASLGNNFNLLLEGKSISITPTGTMEVALPAEFAAVTNAIDKTNNYLSEIGTIVASIAGWLKGQDLSTKEGMASYLREQGMPGTDATEEQIKNWFAGADSVTQAIYKNYLENQGIPFIYSFAAQTTGDYKENTYTVGKGESAVTGQKVVIMEGGTATYATGKVVDGELEHKALPQDYEGQVAAFRGLKNLPEEVSEFIKGISYSGFERTVDDNGNVVWVNKQTRKSVKPAYGGNLEQAYQSALNFINGENGSTYAQALFWAIMGQPEKIPGHGKGIKNSSEITDPSSATVNVSSLLSTINTTLGSIQANTAETNALLAVIASGKSLDTREGKEAYFAALGYGEYNTIDDRIPAPMTADGTQGYNAFDELLWYNQSSAFTQQMYRAFLGPVDAGAWGTDATTTREGIVASSLTPSALATNEQFDDIMSGWVAIVEGTEGKSLDAYRPQLKVEKGTAEYDRYNTGEYIIGDDGYVYNKNSSGGSGNPVLATTGWDVNKLIADKDFLNWFAGSGYGYNYYKGLLPPPTSDAQEPATPTYTAEDKAERAAWLEYAHGNKSKEPWTNWGFESQEDLIAALGGDMGKYVISTSNGGIKLDYEAIAVALAGNATFETEFSTQRAVLAEEYPEKINEYRAMAADKEFLSGYRREEGKWYTADTDEEVVDKGILSRLEAIISKDTDKDGDLNKEFTTLGDQLSAIAKVLGIQLAPETLIDFADGAVVNDAILRSTKAVDDAMSKLAIMPKQVDDFMAEIIRLNLNPQLGNITLEGARELVDAGVLDEDQLNKWVYSLADAYGKKDPEIIARAIADINTGIQEAINNHKTQNDDKINALTANNTELQAQIEELVAQKTSLENSLGEAETDKAALEQQLSTAQENRDAAEARVSTALLNLGAAQILETIAQVNYSNAVEAEVIAHGNATAAQARYDALLIDYQTLVATYGESSPQVQAKAAELAAAEADLAAANAATIAATSAREEAEKSLSLAQGLVTKFEKQLDTANSELKVLQTEVKTLQDKIISKDSEIADLTGQIAEKESEIAGARKTIGDNEATKANLSKENAALTAQINELTKTIATKDSEIADLTRQITEKESEIADANETITAKDTTIADLHTENAVLQEQVASLQEQLSSMEGKPPVEEPPVEEPSAATDELVEAEALTLNALTSGDTLTIEFVPAEESPTEEVAAEESEDALSPEQLETILGFGTSNGYADQLGELLYELLLDYDEDDLETLNALQRFQNAYSTMGKYANEWGEFTGVETQEQANSLVEALNNLGLLSEQTYSDLNSLFNDSDFNTEAFNNYVNPLMSEIYQSLLEAASSSGQLTDPYTIFKTFSVSLTEEFSDFVASISNAASIIEQAVTRLANTKIQIQVNSNGAASAGNKFVETATRAKPPLPYEADLVNLADTVDTIVSTGNEFVETVLGVELPTPYEAYPVNLADTAEKMALAGSDFVETVIGAEPHTPYEAYPVNLADTADEVTSAGNEFVEAMIGIEPPAKRLADNLGTAAGYVDSFASVAGGAIGALRMIINSWATIPNPSSKIGGAGFVAGNVSGLAYASGNTSLDNLNLGARLAGKTLVGELGPELAVYDGMYHLLGQNGAEFVDLPSDAIVFNHHQTAGIIRGQVGYRGTALAEGNVEDLEGEAFAEGHITGPARASIDQTISQLKSLRAMWQNILDMDASQLAQAGGGGGGGNSLKATTADLEEWYNLMRQIEQIEQEITNLEAKRANIYDGSDYLKNLRETQKLLEKQRLTQQRLYEYQQKQLQAQADFINQHEIWSKFLTVGEDGLLQYIKGNEQVGGKGAIEVLQKLNEMSGAEQEKFVKSLGYTAKDEEGKALEGEKLVARFYEELQDQIDQYDELYDTVHATSAELEELTSQIEEANKEIAENQKELETNIYDIVVNAWEKEIELLEEQAKLVEETNKAYTDGLKKALDAERDLYEENKSTEERESLQRQLALLRRSGGSAAEIADLEEQLDDALKDEYFKTQEKMIENIEDANERQVKKLEEQITLQKEALEYEKDNGIIWTKVYDVLRGSQESILAFMQGNSTEFFTKSALEQEEMLLDWAKKIGIYSEDQQYKTAMAEAEKHWNSEAMWGGEVLNGLQGNYESLSDEQKVNMAEYFKKSYSTARLDGSTEAEAQRIAEESIKAYLTEDGAGTGIEDMGGGSSSGSNSNLPKLYYGGYTTDGTFVGGEKNYVYGNESVAKQYAVSRGILADKGSNYFRTGSSPITPWRKWYIEDENGNKLEAKGYSTKAEAEAVINKYKARAEANAKEIAQARAEGKEPQITPLTEQELKYTRATAKFYSAGGLVDYTGIAVVHGSKSKPESFLNAEQTAQIKEALQATNGKSNLLENLYSTVDKLRSLVHSFSNINNSKNYDITIAPGAVVINVDELANSYDVEELSNDIMNRMATIASKATNRGVSRR